MGALLAEAVTNSESMAGLARTSSTLGAALVAIPLALLANRRGRRISLGSGWLLAAVGGVALVLSAALGSVIVLIIGMLMFGSGNRNQHAVQVRRHRHRDAREATRNTVSGGLVHHYRSRSGAQSFRTR